MEARPRLQFKRPVVEISMWVMDGRPVLSEIEKVDLNKAGLTCCFEFNYLVLCVFWSTSKQIGNISAKLGRRR